MGEDAATGITSKDVIGAMKGLPFFKRPVNEAAYSRRRQSARFFDPSDGYDVMTGQPTGKLPKLTGKLLFRGSGPGAKAGPWVSQFMLLGNEAGGRVLEDGEISYGSQFISQKTKTFRAGLDYMTNWQEWLDVQNGANFRDMHLFAQGEDEKAVTRFITTPRDIATYVRFDALYQAYLNACLVMLGTPTIGTQDGFPEMNDKARTGFASFGGPHVLSLVTEVATRCLKFARRQKFNWHRRARPEKVSGLLAVGDAQHSKVRLGKKTQKAIDEMLEPLAPIAELVKAHNAQREGANHDQEDDAFRAVKGKQPKWIEGSNLLLAMAFPEGSPMHPAYAAGHATVAGGCVTMLKAFFKTLNTETNMPVSWSDIELPVFRASEDGSRLDNIESAENTAGMTLEGELNKLAANISIARNMAGVHYYSDYYDSLRMGERVAVGILLEQMQSYDEPVSIVFRSFDGEIIEISTANAHEVIIDGGDIDYRDWVARPQKA